MSHERVREILASVLDGRGDGASLPQRLCVACADALPVNGVGLALRTTAGHGGVVAATDGSARTLEDIQFTLGEGPCIDATRQGRPVLQPDLASTAPRRWPGFGPAVLDAGIGAVFAFPLQIGAIRLGVLDLYRDTAGGLDDRQLGEALAFADAAVAVLMYLQSQTTEEGLHPQLADTLDGGPEIHQATGMIAVQAAVGLAEALVLLRAHAFAAERRAADIARDVVGRRLHFRAEEEDNG